MNNKFTRTINLIGEDNFNKLKDKHILILGLGGVGGYSLEAIVRSGINNMTIVDFDKVDITNINRQIIANIYNIGEYKTEEWYKRIKSINPDCDIKIINEKIDLDNIELLFKDNIDYIIDACDTIIVKKQLIIECINRNIKLISCMGMGNKLDPSKIEITSLDKTNNDKIAKILRKFVKDNKINKRIMVVSSTEEVIKNDSKTINSISYVPSVAGLLLASYIINDILNNKWGNYIDKIINELYEEYLEMENKQRELFCKDYIKYNRLLDKMSRYYQKNKKQKKKKICF